MFVIIVSIIIAVLNKKLLCLSATTAVGFASAAICSYY